MLFMLIPIFWSFSIVESRGEFSPKGGYFEGELRLLDVASNYVDQGAHDPGHTEFKLLQPYTYKDKLGRSWTAPAGSVVNGASIPKAIWSWIGGPWSGRYRNAAVIHDWMCEKKIADSTTAHRIFHEALLVNGVSTFHARVMYEAVLLGGPQWNATPFGPSSTKRREFTSSDLQKIIAKARRQGFRP